MLFVIPWVSAALSQLLFCLPSVLTLCRLRLCWPAQKCLREWLIPSLRIRQSLAGFINIILSVATCYTSPSKSFSEACTFGSRPEQILFAKGHVLHVMCKTNLQIIIVIIQYSYYQPFILPANANSNNFIQWFANLLVIA